MLEMNLSIWILLLLSKIFSSYGTNCNLKVCSMNYSIHMQKNKINIGSNKIFCETVNSYLNCLNKTQKYCKRNAQFHIIQAILNKQKKYFNCKSIEKIKDNYHCSIFFNNFKKIKEFNYYCAIFGSSHIQTFSKGTFHCPFSSGTYTAISNKYFSVQITFGYSKLNLNQMVKIKKISVIINKVKNCTQRRSYVITDDSKKLLTSFNDGMAYGGKRLKPSIEVRKSDLNSIEISLNHIISKIKLYKFNDSLSISISGSNIRKKLNIFDDKTLNYNNLNYLCYNGCINDPSSSYLLKDLNITKRFKNFEECYNVKPIYTTKFAKD
uniref:DRAG-1 (inferred by orthology to a C. elegans protein) n=1 Tax=Strongyloides venezuelensis TaxID=75913 RepID=A0A0K0F8F8_STRVS